MVKILRFPSSTEECVYFTRRVIGDKNQGNIIAWVFKEDCPECGKAKMAKPKDPKTGRPKIRAKEYVCEECGHTEEKKEYEEKLICSIQYKCPHCSHEGETQVPFKRKKFEKIDSIIFECESCKQKIPITKKMKG